MKILFLVNKHTYHTKMSRVRFHGIRALEKIADVTYWGLNWENYNKNLTVQQNLDNMKDNFDICITFNPVEYPTLKDINIPKCIRYNEMWNINWAINQIKECGNHLIICHHLNDYEKYQKMNIPGLKIVYIAHCADKTIFKDYNIKKEYDILIAGAIGNIHYPLRNRFLRLLSKFREKYKCYLHPHPGYNLNDAYTDRYLKEYAININKSKIVLACSSKWKYRLGKYIEIPMCGTSAICGDLPDDNLDDYSYVIEVNNSMTDKEIIDKISYYLDNEDKRLEKVKKGIDFAKNYTQEHYARRLLKEIQLFLNR